jgi:hypothetical protein
VTAAALIHTASRGYPPHDQQPGHPGSTGDLIADKTIVDETATRAAVNEVIAAE